MNSNGALYIVARWANDNDMLYGEIGDHYIIVNNFYPGLEHQSLFWIDDEDSGDYIVTHSTTGDKFRVKSEDGVWVFYLTERGGAK